MTILNLTKNTGKLLRIN